MTKPSNARGGKREGSGRKQKADKKQRITFTLSTDVIEFLKSNRPASKTLEKAVIFYKENVAKT